MSRLLGNFGGWFSTPIVNREMSMSRGYPTFCRASDVSLGAQRVSVSSHLGASSEQRLVVQSSWAGRSSCFISTWAAVLSGARDAEKQGRLCGETNQVNYF